MEEITVTLTKSEAVNTLKALSEKALELVPAYKTNARDEWERATIESAIKKIERVYHA